MLIVVIGILLCIVIGGGVAFFVMRATGESTSSSPASPEPGESASSSPAAPEPGDPTAVGDSPQHAEGDADRSGGSGEPISGPKSGGRGPSLEPDEPARGRYKRDSVGGEGEGESTIDAGEAPKPQS